MEGDYSFMGRIVSFLKFFSFVVDSIKRCMIYLSRIKDSYEEIANYIEGLLIF